MARIPISPAPPPPRFLGSYLGDWVAAKQVPPPPPRDGGWQARASSRRWGGVGSCKGAVMAGPKAGGREGNGPPGRVGGGERTALIGGHGPHSEAGQSSVGRMPSRGLCGGCCLYQGLAVGGPKHGHAQAVDKRCWSPAQRGGTLCQGSIWALRHQEPGSARAVLSRIVFLLLRTALNDRSRAPSGLVGITHAVCRHCLHVVDTVCML